MHRKNEKTVIDLVPGWIEMHSVPQAIASLDANRIELDCKISKQ